MLTKEDPFVKLGITTPAITEWELIEPNISSLDVYGNYFATCADDSKVIIFDIYKNSFTEHKFNRPITSISIDPLYSKNKLVYT
jgi:hypothetical protein